MNPDHVIGTAVLVETESYQWLFYLSVGRNLQGVTWNSLPVLPEGAPQPAEKLPPWFPENRPWRYRIAGETLHVSPSVNLSNGWWHNDGQWSVAFVRAPEKATTAELKDNVLPRRLAILEQLAAVNPDADTARLREAVASMRNRQ